MNLSIIPSVGTGSDDDEDKGAVDYVLEMLEIYNNSSKIFKDYDYYCVDILQSLIILPLQAQDFSNMGKIFKTFLKEWSKIENEISNEFYNIYILKEVVNIARNIRPEYLKKTYPELVTIFYRKNGMTEVRLANAKNIENNTAKKTRKKTPTKPHKTYKTYKNL